MQSNGCMQIGSKNNHDINRRYRSSNFLYQGRGRSPETDLPSPRKMTCHGYSLAPAHLTKVPWEMTLLLGVHAKATYVLFHVLLISFRSLDWKRVSAFHFVETEWNWDILYDVVLWYRILILSPLSCHSPWFLSQCGKCGKCPPKCPGSSEGDLGLFRFFPLHEMRNRRRSTWSSDWNAITFCSPMAK